MAPSLVRWKLRNQIIGILALILLASCASTLTVESDSEKKAGIPFFVQKEIIQKETKYLYDWIEISLIKESIKMLNATLKLVVLNVKAFQTLADTGYKLCSRFLK